MTRDLKTTHTQRQFLRRILFWFIILTGVFLIWYLLMGTGSFLEEDTIYVPVSINAIEVADYKLDAPGMVNPISLSIIAEVIEDQSTSVETSIVLPITPIVTMTPNIMNTSTVTPNTLATLTPAIATTTLIPNTISAASPTVGLLPILPSLQPVLSTVLAPIPTIIPPVLPIVPTVIQVIPSLIPNLPLPLPPLFP